MEKLDRFGDVILIILVRAADGVGHDDEGSAVHRGLNIRVLTEELCDRALVSNIRLVKNAPARKLLATGDQ